MTPEQRQKLSESRKGKVWLIHSETKETILTPAGGVETLLQSGWVRCTKKMYRQLAQ